MWHGTAKPWTRVLWTRDGKNDGACFAHGMLCSEENTLMLLHMERACGNFEHDTLEDVLCCPAKRVEALPLPLFRRLDADGLPTHAAVDAHHLGIALKMHGRDVTGHAARSGVACDDYVEDVVEKGKDAMPITERTRRKTGWTSEPGRNSAPVKAYARELQSHGDGVIESYPNDTPEHRTMRRQMMTQRQDSMVPRRHDFDAATAPRGAEGFRAACVLLRGRDRATIGLLSTRPVSCADVPRAMSADVLGAQVRLRRAVRRHRLPPIALAHENAALFALARDDRAAFEEVCQLRADVASALAAARSVEDAPAPPRRRCRHLDLQRLKDSTKYSTMNTADTQWWPAGPFHVIRDVSSRKMALLEMRLPFLIRARTSSVDARTCRDFYHRDVSVDVP